MLVRNTLSSSIVILAVFLAPSIGHSQSHDDLVRTCVQTMTKTQMQDQAKRDLCSCTVQRGSKAGLSMSEMQTIMGKPNSKHPTLTPIATQCFLDQLDKAMAKGNFKQVPKNESRTPPEKASENSTRKGATNFFDQDYVTGGSKE